METTVWGTVKEYLRIEYYDRDGGHENPRIRIELKSLPMALWRKFQVVEMPCVSCGNPIYPLRARKGSLPGSLYYACTCPLEVRMGCARGGRAALEYERFRGHVGPPPAQMSLF